MDPVLAPRRGGKAVGRGQPEMYRNATNRSVKESEVLRRNACRPVGAVAESGQALVEYSLMIALFSIALVGTLGLFGGALGDYYGAISDALGAIF